MYSLFRPVSFTAVALRRERSESKESKQSKDSDTSKLEEDFPDTETKDTNADPVQLKLNAIMQSRTSRDLLINELLELSGDYSMRIHFCAAVTKLGSVHTKPERVTKAKKLVEMFVSNDARFRCDGIPSGLQRRLVSKSASSLVDDLVVLKLFFRAELLEMPPVVEAVNKVDRQVDQFFGQVDQFFGHVTEEQS
jgi:hypothetical protein